jgi:predicted permease
VSVPYLDDMRQALRLFRSRSGFAATVILTMAVASGFLGIAANLAIALMTPRVNGVVNPSQLVVIYGRDPAGEYRSLSVADFDRIRDNVNQFASVAAVDQPAVYTLRTGVSMSPIRVSTLYGDFFGTLGIPGMLGAHEQFEDGVRVLGVVVSQAIGSGVITENRASKEPMLRLDFQPIAVNGLAPDGFDGLTLGTATDAWIVTPRPPDPGALSPRLTVVGRLRDNASIGAVQQSLDRLGGDTMVALPFDHYDPSYRAAVRPVAWVLVIAGVMVLLAACTNLATLSMSLYTTRLAEFAIRESVGGTPRRLIRQLLVEGLMLSVVACALGGVAAFWTRQLVFAGFSPEQAAIVASRMSIGEIGMTSGISFAACAMVFFVCARMASGMGLPVLTRERAALSSDLRGARPRRLLVVIEVAVACCLLAAALSLRGGLRHALLTGPGFDGMRVAVISMFAPTRYGDPARGARFQRDAMARVASMPGVLSANWTSTLPLVSASRAGYRRAGDVQFRPLDTVLVSSGYFGTMAHGIEAGVPFEQRTDAVDSGVAIINHELADAWFPHGALGREIDTEQGGRVRIVGVVANTRYRRMEEPVKPTIYLPMSHMYLAGLHLVVKTAGPADRMLAGISETLRAIDDVEITEERSLATHLEGAVRRDRIAMVFVSACAVLIVGFSMTGPYLLARHAVTSRYEELAIRLALGARGDQIFRLVIGQALTATAIGVAIGDLTALVLAYLAGDATGLSIGYATGLFAVSGTAMALLCSLSAAWPALAVYRVLPVSALR